MVPVLGGVVPVLGPSAVETFLRLIEVSSEGGVLVLVGVSSFSLAAGVADSFLVLYSFRAVLTSASDYCN